jgi:HlyD family secretion protein
MDREIAQEVRTRRTAKRAGLVVVAVAVGVFFIAAAFRWLRPSLERNDVVIAKVTRGAVDITIQASGTVVPNVEQIVSSPVEARVLSIRRHAGDRVVPGDEILTLDTSASRLDLDRLDEKLAQKRNEQAEIRLKVEENLASINGQLEQKKLDAEILHLKAEQNQRLRAAGLVAEQERLAADTAARKADLEIAQLRATLARSTRSGASQIESGARDVRLLEKDREQARQQLDLALMRADRPGVLTWVLADSGTTVRRGDMVARIADLSSFRVTGTISDVHVSRLTSGMPVRVRIDDATTLDGSITSVDPRIENGVAKFEVALPDSGNRKLRNNLRVDVVVVVGSRAGVLRIPRGALSGGQIEEVFVVRGDRAVRTPVRFGVVGVEALEVTSGLAEGDQVIVSNMTNYESAAEVRIHQ